MTWRFGKGHQRFLLLSFIEAWLYKWVAERISCPLVTSEQGRIVIVGGGVLGTMHAIHARRRGYHVVHLEREPEARGASVRNFGLVWVSGRKAGPELALALPGSCGRRSARTCPAPDSARPGR